MMLEALNIPHPASVLLRHGDFRNIPAQSRGRGHAKVRRQGLPLGLCRRVRPIERPCRPPWSGRPIVIQMADEKMDPASAKEMLRGQDDPLNSSSHLGYSILLQRMLVKGFDSEQLVALPWPRFHSDPVRLPVAECGAYCVFSDSVPVASVRLP